SWSATYGIRALDRAPAGLRPGTFHVVIAPTAHGKSALALTAAFETAGRGLRTLYVTKEMRRVECSLRWAAMATGQKCDKLGAHAAEGGDLLPELQRLIPTCLHPRDDLATPMAIAAEVQRAEIEGNPYRLVVVDYLQQYPGPGESATERIDAAVDAIKTMALQRQCAVLAPAQLNRDQDEGSIPQRSNIRGSGAIEQWADVVVAMRKAAGDLYAENGRRFIGDSWNAAAVGMQLAIRKARNAQECTLWGDGPLDVHEPLKMGVGTFRVFDSKSAPTPLWST
ncbi:MAG: DnaB-like helicase C-terminal domain-containing protein, partial [Bacteroidota bacterium]